MQLISRTLNYLGYPVIQAPQANIPLNEEPRAPGGYLSRIQAACYTIFPAIGRGVEAIASPQFWPRRRVYYQTVAITCASYLQAKLSHLIFNGLLKIRFSEEGEETAVNYGFIKIFLASGMILYATDRILKHTIRRRANNEEQMFAVNIFTAGVSSALIHSLPRQVRSTLELLPTLANLTPMTSAASLMSRSIDNIPSTAVRILISSVATAALSRAELSLIGGSLVLAYVNLPDELFVQPEEPIPQRIESVHAENDPTFWIPLFAAISAAYRVNRSPIATVFTTIVVIDAHAVIKGLREDGIPAIREIYNAHLRRIEAPQE